MLLLVILFAIKLLAQVNIFKHNHLVLKRTLNHLAKLAKVFVNELRSCRFESRCSHQYIFC